MKTFDFNFFRGEINPLIFKIITTDFEDFEEGINSIKELYSLDTNVLSSIDKLAISLYIKYYESNQNEYEEFILKELANTNDKQIIKLYTGKNKLSKSDRTKLLSGKITLRELITNGL